MSETHPIVPGITITPEGLASVDPAMAEVLFDLALQLEDATNHPVDVEHVLAAILIAARSGEIDPETSLAPHDPELIKKLAVHTNTVFQQYGGNVGRDD